MEQCNLNPLDTLEENLNPDSDSLQEVINTLLPGISGNGSVYSGGREPMVADNIPSHYQDIGMDSETRMRAAELAAIANSIEERLLPIREFKPEKSYKIDYAGELNPNQLNAVLETSAPLLVIAGAGSGKTRVITYKVSWLIENDIHPSQILLLTFTRKAANEMLSRVQKLLGDKSAGNVMGGTFHSFANNVLRQYGNLIGIPSNFSIIDDSDAADVVDLLKSEMKLGKNNKEQAFPRKGTIQDILSKSRNHELSIPATVMKYFPRYKGFLEELELLDTGYAAYKKASNLMDYDDLLTRLRDQLRDNEAFRNKLRTRIRYVLVDEFQDTNNVQREIVEQLCKGQTNITVVGDDSQSIYSFRGANFENILRFPVSFPNCKVVKIEQNYRSGQGILDFTNSIIDNAKIGFRKKLYSTIPSNGKPRVLRFADGIEEADYIVDRILEILDNSLDLNNFAVLTRASWQSTYVQAELMRRQLPFVVVGGFKFSERRHVKDIVAFLKLTLNNLDAIAWHRILKLVNGIGKVRASEIVTHIHARAGEINFDRFRGRKYYEPLKRIENLYRELNRDGLTPLQRMEILMPFYIPLLKQIEDDFESRIKDLETFKIIAGKYDDLQKFLSDFTLEPPSNRHQDKTSPLTEYDEKPLVVSTIHSAKGLEWNTVFIPHALDGLLPSVRSMETLQDLEEERRLFYVACSRAKENLYITMPAYIQSYDAFFNQPSRFLAEIDGDKYETG